MYRRWFRSALGAFLIATLVALTVRLFVIEDYRITSDSMYPSLWTGDLVFVSKFNYNVRLPFSSFELVSLRRPRRGEVVAFGLPEQAMSTFVKRVVAIEGDVVKIREGILYINDSAASYRSDGEHPAEQWPDGRSYPVKWEKQAQKSYGPVTVPKGHFFALGDNRLDSIDSRTWGPIPYSCLKGRIALIWLSLDAGGTVRKGRSGLWIPVPTSFRTAER